jgi:hypothetical protein
MFAYSSQGLFLFLVITVRVEVIRPSSTWKFYLEKRYRLEQKKKKKNDLL